MQSLFRVVTVESDAILFVYGFIQKRFALNTRAVNSDAGAGRHRGETRPRALFAFDVALLTAAEQHVAIIS